MSVAALKISAETGMPEISAKPVPQSLRQALEALAATAQNDQQLAAALVYFQKDLIAAESARLYGLGEKGCMLLEPAGALSQTEADFARRASMAGKTIVEKTDTGAQIAVPFGIIVPNSETGTAHLVATFNIPNATPLALAMAQERLELSSALARALVTQKSTGPEVTPPRAALDFAQTYTLKDGLAAAAITLKSHLQAEDVLIGAFKSGKITALQHTSGGVLAAGQHQKYSLALCELVDFGGTLSCGAATDAPAPIGIASAFPGMVIAGSAALNAQGDGAACIAIHGAQIQSLTTDVAALSVAVQSRLRSRGIYPAIEQKLAKLPYLVKLPAEQRLPAAKKYAVLGALLLCLVPVPNTVSGTASVEPQTRRIVSAPLLSRIEKVHVQPGDTVIGGKTILVSLDTQTLQAERDQATAALQSALAESATARNDGDPDRERAGQLRAEQAQAQVELIEYRLSEAEVLAPVNGIVMGEDLRRREGAQVNRGDGLFEIATPGAHRAEILVADRDIEKIIVGKKVSLHLDAHTLKRFAGKVERIYPLTETVHGKNVFRVIASLDSRDTNLQPGMGGTARIQSGWQVLGWTVIEPLIDRIRGLLWI
jgi:multidrug efflux pump subunit AcrA (membrane-fusion protein)